MRSTICCYLFLVIGMNCMTHIAASMGDQMPAFQSCFRNCAADECHAMGPDGYLPHYPSHLRLLRWTCPDECKYSCMWNVVEQLQNTSLPAANSRRQIPAKTVPQFFGKWPFVRFWGIQEPASCIFSVLNAMSHTLCVVYFAVRAPSKYPFYALVIALGFINIHGWLWSAVFHARDLPFTERLDYFCAFSIVVSNCLFAVLRLIGMSWKKFLGVTAPLLAIYIQHVRTMLNRFDYGYNMQVNATFVALGAFLWLTFGGYAYFLAGSRHASSCLIVWTGLALAASLELLDFAPLAWTFDAHALWHAATVPLTIVWYRFLVADAKFFAIGVVNATNTDEIEKDSNASNSPTHSSNFSDNDGFEAEEAEDDVELEATEE